MSKRRSTKAGSARESSARERPPREAPRQTSTPSYEDRLAQAKRESTLQVLFKVARLTDEMAIARVAEQHGAAAPPLRRSHTSLLPHLDLEGTRITVLADRLGITKQAVSQLVDELEAFGVLARVPDPDDARARRVVFTERGRQGLLEGLKVLNDIEQEFAREIGRERMAHLRDALLALHDRLIARNS